MYKILIADDEMIECSVLEKMIRDHFPELEILPSVSNGVDLLHSINIDRPDIAVVDIAMPGLNGLDVLEILRLKKQSLKVIVVSAYSKFEYAQKAMNLGASEYLLKPVDDVEFVETIRQTLSSLEQHSRECREKDETKLLRTEMRSLYENILISDIILGSTISSYWEKYFDSIHSVFIGGRILTVHAISKVTEKLDPFTLEKTYLAFLNLFQKVCRCFFKRYQDSLVICILPGEKDLACDTYTKTLFHLLSEIISKPVLQTVQWKIGISDWKYDYKDLPDAYRESKLAMLSEEAGIFFYNIQLEGKPGAIWHPSEIQSFLHAVTQRQPETCSRLLSQMMQKLSSGPDFFHYQNIFCAYLLYRIFQEYACHEWYFSIYWKELFASENTPKLQSHVLSLLSPLIYPQTDALPANKYMVSSLHFIEKYFAQDLSLEQVADSIGITSFYLSRLFKQELGKTFLEILTNYRMAKAFEFLYEKQYSVSEISEQIGYPNTSYFYKLFKKQTGLTIGEFKEYIRLLNI